MAMRDVVSGPDGLPRCGWASLASDYQAYHDLEWGRPVGEEIPIFEKLCLEGFQSGLSWLTILRKRSGFRAAFAGFDPAAVARFEAADVERLLADRGIVRNRAKIEAVIANARSTLGLRDRATSLAALVWSHEPLAGRPPRTFAGTPASTPPSSALARELRAAGFRFVGPTTVYAAMQALGVVNDHLRGCHVRDQVEAERSRFVRPR